MAKRLSTVYRGVSNEGQMIVMKVSQKVFDLKVWGYEDASKMHGEGAEYYVAIGTEH